MRCISTRLASALGLVALVMVSRAFAESKVVPGKADAVDLFQAQASGDVRVKLIPKNSAQATVILENKTDQPLSLRLPEAFAGVPVLAQIGGGGQQAFGGLQGGGGGLQGGGGQALGGGLGGGVGGQFGGGGGQFGGGGGGLFNLPPESTRKLRVATVCLEHGKKDPNPRVPYELIPLETLTKDRQVAALCAMLGRGEIDQVSAQAAAWHVASGVEWSELAQKVKVRHLNGSVELYFSPEQVQRGLEIVQETFRRAALDPSPASGSRERDATRTPSPGENDG